MEEKDKELILGALKKLLEEIEEASTEEDDVNQLMKMTERFTFNDDQLSLRIKECLQEIHKGRQSLDQLLRGSISMLMEDHHHDHHDDEEEGNFERIVWDNVEKIQLLLIEEVTLFSNLEDSIDSIFPQPPQDHQTAHDIDDDDHQKEVRDHDHDDKAKDDDIHAGGGGGDDDDVEAMDDDDDEAMDDDDEAMDDDDDEAIEGSVGSNESGAEEEKEVMQSSSSLTVRMEEIQHGRQNLHEMCQALIVKLERLAISDKVIVSDDKDPETEVKTDHDPTTEDDHKDPE